MGVIQSSWVLYFAAFGPLFAWFLDPMVKKLFAGSPGVLKAWGYIFRFLWGFFIWFMATTLVSGWLADLFAPHESRYLFSGSWITVWPAVFFAIPIIWVVFGPEREGDSGGPYSTADKRIEAVGGFVLGALKVSLWLIGGGLLLVLLFWLGSNFQDRIQNMKSGEAIITGAIIIAFAIYAGNRGRR